MKYPFIIVIDNVPDKANVAFLVDVITSSFVSKRGRENFFIIISENNRSKDIFELIKSKINFNADILIIELDNFYGNFFDINTVNWVKENFPEMNYTIKE